MGGMEGTDGQAESLSLTKHATAQVVAGHSEGSVLYRMLFGLTSRRRRRPGDGGNLAESVELIEQKDSVLDQSEQPETKVESLRGWWTTNPYWEREKLAERLGPRYDKEGTHNGR